jgi:hypothetical protein
VLTRIEAGHQVNLEDQAVLAGWPTPNAMEGGQTSRSGKRKDELLMGGLVGWPTPTTRDHKDGDEQSCTNVPVNALLGRTATLAGWATPVANDDNKSVEAHLAMKKRMGERDGSNANRTAITSLQVQAQLASGPPSTSSPAGTEKHGALNPRFSLWLMGYPAEWACCGERAMQSCRKSRQSS